MFKKKETAKKMKFLDFEFKSSLFFTYFLADLSYKKLTDSTFTNNSAYAPDYQTR